MLPGALTRSPLPPPRAGQLSGTLRVSSACSAGRGLGTQRWPLASWDTESSEWVPFVKWRRSHLGGSKEKWGVGCDLSSLPRPRTLGAGPHPTDRFTSGADTGRRWVCQTPAGDTRSPLSLGDTEQMDSNKQELHAAKRRPVK